MKIVATSLMKGITIEASAISLKKKCPTCAKKRTESSFLVKGKKTPHCKNCRHDLMLLAAGGGTREDSPWHK